MRFTQFIDYLIISFSLFSRRRLSVSVFHEASITIFICHLLSNIKQGVRYCLYLWSEVLTCRLMNICFVVMWTFKIRTIEVMNISALLTVHCCRSSWSIIALSVGHCCHYWTIQIFCFGSRDEGMLRTGPPQSGLGLA